MEQIHIHPAVFNGKCYQHFGIHEKTASLYGDDPKDIVDVKLKISEDQAIPPRDKSMNVDYWGWYDLDKQKFTMIYAKHFLLNVFSIWNKSM